MCNLYEYDMTPEVMQTLKDHFSLVGTAYLDVLRGRNGRQRVYPNYEGPVIRSLATPGHRAGHSADELGLPGTSRVLFPCCSVR